MSDAWGNLEYTVYLLSQLRISEEDSEKPGCNHDSLDGVHFDMMARPKSHFLIAVVISS